MDLPSLPIPPRRASNGLALVLVGEVILALDQSEGTAGLVSMVACALMVAGLAQLRGMGWRVPVLISISLLALVLTAFFAVGDAFALVWTNEDLHPSPTLMVVVIAVAALDGFQSWLLLDLIASVETWVGRPRLANRARRLRVWYVGAEAVLVFAVAATQLVHSGLFLVMFSGFVLWGAWLFRTWYLFEAMRACERARARPRRRRAGTPRVSRDPRQHAGESD